ncbi:hypothetical protein EV702DRAFT_1270015 [Suillus placidus]|uniref:Uncharacterized protein n=1 Tax=Suillus placidus TaxID=48579 RepID=A0A9P6ZQE0_9AGAM|nr:hypothetical protein EV702DRAFT_1270015 [Suillus placidus]
MFVGGTCRRSPHPHLLKPKARFTPTPAKLKPHLQPVNLRDSLPAVPKLTSDLPDDSMKSIIQRSYHTIQPVYQTQRHPPSTKHTQTLSPGTPTPPQCTLLISQSLYGCYAQRSGIDDMDESVELGPSVIPANDALVVTLDFEGMLNQSSLQHYVLKCRLNQQKLTHNTAGEFLHTVKTLMAKLKANDWGALSAQLTNNASSTNSSRPIANDLTFGLQEVHPDLVEVMFNLAFIKNLDNDIPIDIPDNLSEFSLARGLLFSFSGGRHPSPVSCMGRLWFSPSHAGGSLDREIAHSYRQSGQSARRPRSRMDIIECRSLSMRAGIDELMRTFERATVGLRSNSQLCKLMRAALRSEQIA